MSLRIVINPNAHAPFYKEDRIFLGEGLIETIRVTNATPHYAIFHYHRLKKSANYLQIPFCLSSKEWVHYLDQSIQTAKIEEGGIKVTLSSGKAARGLDNYGVEPCMQVDAFPYQPASSFVKLATIPWRRDAANPVYHLKSISYLEAILARRYIKKIHANEALFLNTEGHITETTIANIFLVINNELVTPQLSSGLVAGIMRGRVINAAKVLGVNCTENAIAYDQLIESESVFICNALQGIKTVCSLDNKFFFKTNCLLQDKLALFLKTNSV